VRQSKAQGARFVIVESFYPQSTAQRVADLAGMKLIGIPTDASGALRTYTDLVDYILVQLMAAKGK
jgi:hypothetical protein